MSAIDQDFVRDLIERHSDASGGNGRDFHNGAYARMADEIEQAVEVTLGPCNDSCNCTNGERTDLAAENVKLRELCRRFSEYVSHDRCEGCVVKRRCNDGEVDECWQMGEIRKLARELGVEVEG